MRQYHGIKQQVPNALPAVPPGDFYELFFEDAVLAARELEITLTSRNKEKGQPIPDVRRAAYHASEGYIARLISEGLSGRHLRSDGGGGRSARNSVTPGGDENRHARYPR